MVKYSFLVAIYNVEKYLYRCIESLVSQTTDCVEYEVILIDDGSTDLSGYICDEYSTKYSFIRTIHQENKGLLLARGIGVKNARGQYLIFIDGDDYVDSKLLEVVENKMCLYSPDFLMYSWRRESKEGIKSIFVTEENEEIVDKQEILKRFISTELYNCVWGKVIKAELLRDNVDAIYNRRINIAEDKIQTAYLIKESNLILLIHDCLYNYCVRKDSIVKKKEKQDIYDIVYAYDRIYDVIHDMISILNTNEDRLENDYEKIYNLEATESVLEHIYKFNRQKNYDVDLKEDLMRDICIEKSGFVMRANSIKKSLKFHSRIRYFFIQIKRYRLLIKLDVVIYWFQNIFSHFKTIKP